MTFAPAAGFSLAAFVPLAPDDAFLSEIVFEAFGPDSINGSPVTYDDHLSSGANIKIADREFLLDEAIGADTASFRYLNHYAKTYEPVIAQKTAISGGEGKENLRPERVLWEMTDWSGGEGNKVFNPKEGTKYDYSNGLNPRVRGELTGRPKRELAEFTRVGEPSGAVTRVFVRDGSVFVGSGPVASDGNRIYWSTWASGVRNTFYQDDFASGTPHFVDDGVATQFPFLSLDLLDGKLYGWTGNELWETQVAALKDEPVLSLGDDPPTIQKVYDVGSTVDNFDGNAGSATADSSLIFYRTSGDQSFVYEFKEGPDTTWAARPLWNPPNGFLITDMAYANGIIYFIGTYGDAGESGMYELPLNSLEAGFVTFVRKGDGEKLTSVSASFGNELLITCDSGKVFVYDAELGALSCLDDLADTHYSESLDGINFSGTILGAGTDEHRYVVFGKRNGTGTPLTVRYYSDEKQDRASDYKQDLYSPVWDFDFAAENKTLTNVTLKFEPLSFGQSIKLYYSLDGGIWIGLPTVNTTNNPIEANAGRIKIPVAVPGNSPSFNTLRWRLRLNGVGTQTPVLQSFTGETQLVGDYTIAWELVLRVKDNQNSTRPTNTKVSGVHIRDWVVGVITQGQVVRFLDGYKYRQRGEFTAHNVVIETGKDVIQRNAEGDIQLRLREV